MLERTQKHCHPERSDERPDKRRESESYREESASIFYATKMSAVKSTIARLWAKADAPPCAIFLSITRSPPLCFALYSGAAAELGQRTLAAHGAQPWPRVARSWTLQRSF